MKRCKLFCPTCGGLFVYNTGTMASIKNGTKYTYKQKKCIHCVTKLIKVVVGSEKLKKLLMDFNRRCRYAEDM